MTPPRSVSYGKEGTPLRCASTHTNDQKTKRRPPSSPRATCIDGDTCVRLESGVRCKAVEKMVRAFFPSAAFSVQVVCNRQGLARYKLARQQYISRTGVSAEEEWLWHGTGEMSTVAVARHHDGLDIRYARPGNRFGRAVYFTSNLACALGYAHVEDGMEVGHPPTVRTGLALRAVVTKRVLLCRVLTGKPYIASGCENMSVALQAPPGHDCVRSLDVSGVDVAAIYNNDHILITHVVAFTYGVYA